MKRQGIWTSAVLGLFAGAVAGLGAWVPIAGLAFLALVLCTCGVLMALVRMRRHIVAGVLGLAINATVPLLAYPPLADYVQHSAAEAQLESCESRLKELYDLWKKREQVSPGQGADIRGHRYWSELAASRPELICCPSGATYWGPVVDIRTLSTEDVIAACPPGVHKLGIGVLTGRSELTLVLLKNGETHYIGRDEPLGLNAARNTGP